MTRLDPDRPVASLLDAAGLSQSELARRLGGPDAGPSLVSAPLQREREGASVTVRWLARAARAAGFRLEMRVVRERRKKST